MYSYEIRGSYEWRKKNEYLKVLWLITRMDYCKKTGSLSYSFVVVPPSKECCVDASKLLLLRLPIGAAAQHFIARLWLLLSAVVLLLLLLHDPTTDHQLAHQQLLLEWTHLLGGSGC